MSKDRYKYFRIESRELLEGLSRGVLELEKGGPPADLVAKILRLAHTLKGAARVVTQSEIADLAHRIEDTFADYRENDAISAEKINQALGLLDGISARIALLDAPAPQLAAEAPVKPPEEFIETVRVEIEEADKLLNSLSEASIQLTSLRQQMSQVDRARQLAGNLAGSLTLRGKAEASAEDLKGRMSRARAAAEELDELLERLDRNLSAGAGQVEAELTQSREAANRLRLLPTAGIFPSLERAVRDAAQSLRKEVIFVTTGGGNRVESHVLSALRDALLHVVRNAVTHGIESPRERLAAGKPAQGRIEMKIERRGTRIAFICKDDGRGIDLEAVRTAAVKRGLIPASKAPLLGLDELLGLILKGGVSTAGSVDELSGRGVGLDVVRETAARLRGEVSIKTESGKGASVEVCVPVSLSSIAAVQAEAGRTPVSFPLDSVRRILRLTDSDVVRADGRDSILFDGRLIPFLNLASALGRRSQSEKRLRAWPAIVVQSLSGVAAVGTDRLAGTGTIVVKPLPGVVRADAAIAGASLDTEGNPRLVLDPEGLVAAASTSITPTAESAAVKPPPVLVIDDSLTTRMLEQSILESAGYDVDTATSGEEGLAKARDKTYGLFLVDVEMPGIDGFEFVTRTRLDPVLRSVPAILVTSRNTVEDRLRGEQAGACAYIVKGDFDQAHLLNLIRELIG